MTILLIFNLVFLLMGQSCCVDDIITAIKSNCPYSTFCKTAPEIGFPENDPALAPCCSQCSCSRSCWKFGTCCPDAARNPPKDVELAVCHDSVLNFTVDTVTSKEYSTNVEHYRMILSCPANYTNIDIVRKCENSSNFLPHSLDDVAMVSDAQEHDEIYKNRHCAACHGVTYVIRWDLTTALCDSDIFHADRSMSKMFQYVFNNCIVHSVPNSTISLTPRSTCYSKTISRCNETGLMDSIDAEMEHQCHESYYPYFDTRGYRKIVYRNVGCFLCNRPIDIPPPVVCKQSLIKSTRLLSGGILALLDFDTPYLKEVDEKIGDCNDMQIYDSFMEICRPFRCPLFSSPFYGSCFPVYTHTSNVKVQFKIRLTPIQSDVLLPDILSIDDEILFVSLQDIYNRLIGKLSLTNCDKCEMFADFYKNETRNGGIFVMTCLLSTTNRCQFESIAKAISYFDQKVNLTLRTTTLSIGVVPSPYFTNHDYDGYFQRSQGYRFRCSSERVDVTELSICPHITMTIEEYHAYMAKHGGVERIPSNESAKNNNTLLPGFYYISKEPIVVATCTTNMALNISNKSLNLYTGLILKALMSVLILLLFSFNSKLA